MKKLAIFRFEASATIGAGHAIRSCVLADALREEGWDCKVVTTATTYDFIRNLERFERINPENFQQLPLVCDLLVIDNYDLDYVYETRFRDYAEKIMVIDDLANRHHDCDILLDQTYGRGAVEYKDLVPSHCKILAGSDYVLLRKEFREMRAKALEKRRNTTEIKRILISMGGSDQHAYILKALSMIKYSDFEGVIDIVLGFDSVNLESITNYIVELPNKCNIHVNADMSKLMYEADLAIGAAGTSVWERCCLGLPQVLIEIADNQKEIYRALSDLVGLLGINEINSQNYLEFSNRFAKIVDGLGSEKVAGIL